MLTVIRTCGFARSTLLTSAEGVRGEVCVGLHPDATVTESKAMGSENSFIVFHGRLAPRNLRVIRDSRLFGCIIENPLIGLSRMFVVQTSLRLLSRSVRLLLLEPTLFQGG